ncbi:MAG: stage II sporulation protein M [Acidimicrobiales bacterium]
MDIDRFVVANSGMWGRLEELSARARRSRGTMSPAEVDELVALYQRTSAQLSHARGYFDDAGLTARLTTIVAAANAAIYGARRGASRSLRAFFAETFPAAVYVSRRFIAVAAVLMFVPAIAVGAWVATSPEALRVAVPEEEQQALVQSQFEDYYSSAPAAEFSTRVQVNNIQVSFMAFAFGIAGGVLTAALLVFNGLNVGVAAGLFWHAGEAGRFFGLILPHGLLELTSIVIAGAAGLRLGWAMIAPGDRTRGDALAEEGRRSIVLVIGLMLCFVVAGFIEAFVTPSGLPTLARVGVGLLVEAAFILWVVGRGRDAVASGHTGLFGEAD